jgi:hypothetical protein
MAGIVERGVGLLWWWSDNWSNYKYSIYEKFT